LLQDDFKHALSLLKDHRKIIEELRLENKKLKWSYQNNNKLLIQLNEANQTINKYEESLREVDNHIRATDDPIPYIVKTLKKTLPEYD
jgi:septal ring factor EnvC (AmiA/AmiB activator)